MHRKWIGVVFMAALAGLSFAAEKLPGRAPPGKVEVPADIHYEVRSYRSGSNPRAGQIGIAVAKKYLEDKDARRPVVVFIHGGGWRQGDKDQCAWRCIQYAEAGYVAATVSYRLMDEAPFPACVEDVMEAIRYVKSLAAELPLDPGNIGLYGYSAGAHLALMTALAGREEGFHSGAYSEYDSGVKCVVAVSAPTAFVERRKREGPLKMLSEEQNEDEPFLERVSPLHYIAAGQVPILMLHGTEDELVPSYHYQYFQDRCEDEGVENFRLVTAPGGGHMFFFRQGKAYVPIMNTFFTEHLQGE